MAHELAHVRNWDILISSIAATLAATIIMIARMAQFAMIFGGGRSERQYIQLFSHLDSRPDCRNADFSRQFLGRGSLRQIVSERI